LIDRIREMQRIANKKHLKEGLKKPSIRGVRYVSTDNSMASPRSQYDEFVNA
jgi:hypothetical protein